MSQPILSPPAPSWTLPIAAGALATFLLHSVALVVPEFWSLACCACGLTGAPVGFLPAMLARRQDPHLGPAQGFAVSFIATGVGALIVAFLTMVVQGWEVPPEVLDDARQRITEMNREVPADEQWSETEIEEMVQTLGSVLGYLPLITSGMLIVIGGLTGMITVALMGRRAPPPPPA